MDDTARSPRVEACIQNAMEKYGGGSPRRDLTYYQNVHQDLAPLARELENALLIASARIAQLEQALASRPAEVDDELITDRVADSMARHGVQYQPGMGAMMLDLTGAAPSHTTNKEK